jgi:hypothetical protein
VWAPEAEHPCPRLGYIRGTVGGAIVNNDDFQRCRILREDGIEGLSEEARSVEDRDNDRDFHQI